jgi:hypothetical protein
MKFLKKITIILSLIMITYSNLLGAYTFKNYKTEKIDKDITTSIYVYHDKYIDTSLKDIGKEENKKSLYITIKDSEYKDPLYKTNNIGVGNTKTSFISSDLEDRKEVQLADISYNLGCSDQTMKLQKSAPLLRNYQEQIKIFAPTSIDPFTEEIDSTELFKVVMETMGEEEKTEKYLDFLAYIHYIIQSSLSSLNDPDKRPPQDNMFKKSEFKACMASTTANMIEEELNFGVGLNSYDDESFKYGLDITAYSKAFSCFDRRKGPVIKGENEQKRYEYSKYYIKSLFDKYMAGQFTFSKKSSKICEDLYSEMKYEQPVNKTEAIEILRASKLGQIAGFDGGITTIGVEYESKYHMEPTGGQAGTVSAKLDPSSVNILESYSSDTSGNAVSGGELRSVRDTDFKTRITYKPTPEQIDIMDIPDITRLKFLENVKNDFIKNIEKSKFYDSISSLSKNALKFLMDRVTNQLELNPEKLKMLNCAINDKNCDFPWITEIEYKRVIDNNGESGSCKKMSANNEFCKEYEPNQSLQIKDITKDLMTVNSSKQKIYMRKIIDKEMGLLVENYYRTAGGLVFSKDFDGSQHDKTLYAIETGKRKIELLKTGVLIKNNWLSPISIINTKTYKLIQDRLDKVDYEISSNTDDEREDMYKNISNISNQNEKNILNYLPYIYRPLNELEVAKQIFAMSDIIKIFQILNKRTNKPEDLTIKPDDWSKTKKADFLLNKLNGLNLDSYYGNTNFPSITKDKSGKPIYIEIPTTISNYKTPLKSSFKITAEELANVKVIFSKFSNYYISRLKTMYTKRVVIIKNELIKRMEKYKMDKTNLAILEAEIEKIDFKMEQRFNMLNLLKRY